MEVRSVEAIARALNHAGVTYFFVGGFAVNAHGFVRMTRDLDIVISLDRENIFRGLEALFGIGYKMAIPATAEDFANPAVREVWRREKEMLVLKLWSDAHQRTPIDLFIYEPFDVEAEADQGLRMEIAPGVPAPIVSLKTLIAMKKEAGRPEDLIDIQELTRLS